MSSNTSISVAFKWQHRSVRFPVNFDARQFAFQQFDKKRKTSSGLNMGFHAFTRFHSIGCGVRRYTGGTNSRAPFLVVSMPIEVIQGPLNALMG